jgi:hypothetical protein
MLPWTDHFFFLAVAFALAVGGTDFGSDAYSGDAPPLAAT